MIRRNAKDLQDIPRLLKSGKTAAAESILYRKRHRSPELVETAYRIIVSHAGCNGDRLPRLFNGIESRMKIAEKADIALFYQVLVPYFMEQNELETVDALIEKSMKNGLSRSSFGPIWSVYCEKKGWLEEARQTLVDYFGFENAPAIAKRLEMKETADSFQKEWRVAA